MAVFKVRSCLPSDLATVLALADNEFIINKNRSMSLSSRFRNVFSANNIENIYVVDSQNEILSALCSRTFDWFTDDRGFKGAMIGLVVTKPEHRRKGLGEFLLRNVSNLLQDKGIDFGCLWTTIPQFYRPLGWVEYDIGIFGEVVRNCEDDSFIGNCESTDMLGGEPDFSWMESVRYKWVTKRLRRTSIDYQVLPPSVHSVRCYFRRSTNGDDAYALVGESGETGFIYEMYGHTSQYSHIWQSIIRAYKKVYVNDCRGSMSANWLGKNGIPKWHFQNQAMWMKLSPLMRDISLDEWHIPYFDRI